MCVFCGFILGLVCQEKVAGVELRLPLLELAIPNADRERLVIFLLLLGCFVLERLLWC